MMKLAQPLVCQRGGDYDGYSRDARRVRPNPNSLNILQCFPFEDARTVRPLLIKCLPHLPQQLRTSIFEQGNDEVERLGAVVIGVGDEGVRVLREVVRHAHDLLLCLFRGGGVVKLAHVVIVHRHDEVEAREIFLTHRARTVCEVIPTALGASTHTAICQFAFVIVNHARRINHKLVSHPCPIGKRAKDFFRRDGTADISEADEENFHWVKVIRG